MNHDEVGGWTKTQLDILRRYLKEYTLILSKQKWCRDIYYIDGFSSTGKHILKSEEIDKEEEAYINGSPSVALETRPKLTKSIFVELDYKKVEKLEESLNKYRKSSSFEIINGDANIVIPKIINQINWTRSRGFVLLDPYGVDINWDTIESIGQANGLEVLINLPIMAIQRDCLVNQFPKLDERAKRKVRSFFGDESVLKDIYVDTGQTDFFDSIDVKKVSNSGEAVVEFYRKNLQKHFKFVTESRLMLNSRGGPLYYLIAAGQNETGMGILGWLLRNLGK